jgi:PAS domain S-box-containing protein
LENLVASLSERGIGVFITDRTPDGDGMRFVYVSPAVAAICGRTVEELLTLDPWQTLSPELHDRQRARLRSREQDEMTLTELVLARKDGTRVDVETYAMSFQTPSGLRFVGAVRDISQQKAMQRVLRESAERLAWNDRMASLGRLAAGVAHEINNPLAYLVLNLELISSELNSFWRLLPEGKSIELRQLLADARKGADTVRQIVRDLKGLSRAGNEAKGALELPALLDACLNMASAEIRTRARIVKNYGVTPRVLAEDGRLRQVFLNLLMNAAQAIAGGNDQTNFVRVTTSTNAEGHAVVEIRDSGRGIPAEIRDRIFEPFFTTKPVGEGTGLGLAICHGIVTDLGGQISAESLPGQGSVFRVVLPPAPATARPAPVRTKANTKQTTPDRGGRVLIVDDNEMFGTSLAKVVGRQHEVEFVKSGEEALAFLKKGNRYDAILCDLMMPGITGMDLHALVSKLAPDQAVRMIFMTGGATSHAASTFLAEVENERLEKPIDGPHLDELLRRVMSSP